MPIKNNWKEVAKSSLSPAGMVGVKCTRGVNFNGFYVANLTTKGVDLFHSISSMPVFEDFSNEVGFSRKS